MTNTMNHLYLSYERSDYQFASMVRAMLEQAGFAVWMDAPEQRTRERWHTEIEQAIKGASALVLVVSPAARTSEYVTYEWAFALGAGKAVLLLESLVTDVHPRLGMLPRLDCTHPDEALWDNLCALVHRVTGTPVAPPARPLAPTETGTGRLVPPDTASAIGGGSDQAAVRDALLESLHHAARDVRIQAALMLAQFKEEQAVPVLIEAMHDRDKDVHQHAAWGLLHIGRPAAPALIDALHQGETDNTGVVCRDVARVLGQIGDPQAVAVLTATLDDSRGEVRRAAAEALGNIRDAAAVSVLCRRLHDDEEYVRRAAAEALGQIGNAGAVHELIAAMHDSSESVRVVAAWALGQMRDAAAIPALVAALRQPNPHVRQAAAETLKEIGDHSAEPGLNDALMDEDTEVRRVAARVLGHIRSRKR